MSLKDYSLFIDKYKPNNLSELKFNTEINHILANMSNVEDIPHMIIHGPSGSGKKLRARLFLYEKYGNFNSVSNIIQVNITKGKNKTEDVKVIHSPFHFQLDPSVHGVYDRVVIRQIIQDVVQCNMIQNTSKQSWNQAKYRIIIIENMDKLTHEAQQSLRRTLEVNINTCRMIFIASDMSKIIAPLKSRCLTLSLSAPNQKEIYKHLRKICIAEEIKYSTKGLTSLSNFTDRNLKRSIMFLQLISVKCPNELEKDRPDFKHIDNAQECLFGIVKTQIECHGLVEATDEMRKHIYDLQVHCMDPSEIIYCIFNLYLRHLRGLSKKTNIDLKGFIKKITHEASNFNYTVKKASQPIYHIEAFCMHLLHISKLISHKLANG